jgi:hypothetical protein
LISQQKTACRPENCLSAGRLAPSRKRHYTFAAVGEIWFYDHSSAARREMALILRLKRRFKALIFRRFLK